MSDETDDAASQSIFAEHRTGVLSGIAVLVAAFGVVVAIAQGWLPNLFAIFGTPLIIGVVSLGLFGLGAVYLYTRYTGSDNGEWPWAATPEQQLSKEEARVLTEWALYMQDPPVKVGEYERKAAKPETNQNSGSSTRVYDAIFKELHGSTYYAVVVNLEDEIDFETEWVAKRTPENIEKATEAVHELNNWEVLEQRSQESYAAFRDRVKDARKQLGQCRRTQKTVEHYDDDGELSKRETIDISAIQSQNSSQGD